MKPRDGERPLVLFHRERMDERQRNEAERDLGVALCRDGPAAAALALPLLEAALAARPDDLAAWEAKGFALEQLGRYAEGLATFRSALDREPGRESALIGAADAAARAGRRDDAIADLRRAIAINPSALGLPRRPGLPLLQRPRLAGRRRGRPGGTPPEPRRHRDPQAPRPVATSAWETRRPHTRELQTLLGFDPPDRDELMRWFAPLTQPR